MHPRRWHSVPQASLLQFALSVLLATPISAGSPTDSFANVSRIATSLVTIANLPLSAVAQAQTREEQVLNYTLHVICL